MECQGMQLGKESEITLHFMNCLINYLYVNSTSLSMAVINDFGFN